MFVLLRFFEDFRRIKRVDAPSQNGREFPQKADQRNDEQKQNEEDASTRREPFGEEPAVAQNSQKKDSERQCGKSAERGKEIDAANCALRFNEPGDQRLFRLFNRFRVGSVDW